MRRQHKQRQGAGYGTTASLLQPMLLGKQHTQHSFGVVWLGASAWQMLQSAVKPGRLSNSMLQHNPTYLGLSQGPLGRAPDRTVPLDIA